MFCMYLPIAVSGYLVYGSKVHGNILLTIPKGGLKMSSEILITGHLICAFIINLNPVSLDMEELFNVPNSKC